MGVEVLHGALIMLLLCHRRVPYAAKIWISQTRLSFLVCVGSGSAFSATKEFLKRTDAVRGAGSNTTVGPLWGRQLWMEAVSDWLVLVA